MELNIKSIILFLAILTTALSAGLFYAWQVSVIPGLKNIPSKSYLEVMQSINRAILNPGFFIIFFGSLILMILSVYFQYKVNINIGFWLITGGTICYALGTFGVTVLGNVPMNEALDIIHIDTLSWEELENTRLSFEKRWNQLHTVRTIFSVLAFVLLLLGAFANGTEGSIEI